MFKQGSNNNWVTDDEAKIWLSIMNYHHNSIEWVKAIVLHGHKADLNVQVQIKLKNWISKTYK